MIDVRKGMIGVLMTVAVAGCGGPTTPELGDGAMSHTPLGQLSPKRPTSDPEINALFDQFVKVYAEATSYRDTGKVVRTEAPRSNPDKKNESTLTFRTQFARPDRFLLEIMEPGEGGSSATKEAYWTESGPSKLNIYAGDPPAMSESDMMNGLPLSDPLAKIIPRLLIKEIAPGHRRTLDRMEVPELPKETVEVDGHPCHDVYGNYDGYTTHAYIDAETHVLRKVVLRGSTQGSVIEITITYQPELGVEIPAEDFQFRPPATP